MLASLADTPFPFNWKGDFKKRGAFLTTRKSFLGRKVMRHKHAHDENFVAVTTSSDSSSPTAIKELHLPYLSNSISIAPSLLFPSPLVTSLSPAFLADRRGAMIEQFGLDSNGVILGNGYTSTLNETPLSNREPSHGVPGVLSSHSTLLLTELDSFREHDTSHENGYLHSHGESPVTQGIQHLDMKNCKTAEEIINDGFHAGAVKVAAHKPYHYATASYAVDSEDAVVGIAGDATGGSCKGLTHLGPGESILTGIYTGSAPYVGSNGLLSSSVSRSGNEFDADTSTDMPQEENAAFRPPRRAATFAHRASISGPILAPHHWMGSTSTDPAAHGTEGFLAPGVEMQGSGAMVNAATLSGPPLADHQAAWTDRSGLTRPHTAEGLHGPSILPASFMEAGFFPVVPKPGQFVC